MSKKVTAALVLSVGNVLFTAMIALVIGQLATDAAAISVISTSLGTFATPAIVGVVLVTIDVVMWAYLFARWFVR